MQSHVKSLFLVPVFLLVALGSYAAPVDESAWIACENDTQCTSVELHCSYWQPVNSLHVNDMKAKYTSSCIHPASSDPQPFSGCTNHMCVNESYTIHNWRNFALSEKSEMVDKQILTCLKSVPAQADWIEGEIYYDKFREPFLEKVNILISRGTFSDSQPLQEAIETMVPCKDVISAAQLFH